MLMYNLYLSLLASQLCAYPDNPYISTHKSKSGQRDTKCIYCSWRHKAQPALLSVVHIS